MAKVVIDVISQRVKKEEEILNDLLWYDPVDKGMRNFKGTKLSYEYVEFPDVEVFIKGMGWIKGKTVAKADVDKKVTYAIGSNINDIMAWVDENEEEFNLSISSQDSREVVIEFDAELMEKVEDSLYGKRFRYEFIDD